MTLTTRARKGGQHGKNGEWYEGGQFLPSSKTTVKGEFSKGRHQTEKTPSRKQEIAPYKWEVSDRQSIWKKCGVGYYSKFTKTGYSKETGSQGFIEIYPSPVWNRLDNDEQAEIENMIDRWNRGERWV